MADQFADPRGMLGWVVGHLMAWGDAPRSRWVLAHLDLQPTEQVLEIGFGPGADIQRVQRLVLQGHVSGLDHSPVMLAQARRRNRAGLHDGRVDLRLGSADAPLPFPTATFDMVFTINTLQFWRDPEETLREIARVLRPGGRVALAVQPLHAGATAADADAWQQHLITWLTQGGWAAIITDQLPQRPTPVILVMARRPQ